LKLQYSQITQTTPKPFVKWAGGKRQLLPIIEQNLPEKFDTYFEPDSTLSWNVWLHVEDDGWPR
jgi:hypothetical protein